jgi:hypothetical protein
MLDAVVVTSENASSRFTTSAPISVSPGWLTLIAYRGVDIAGVPPTSPTRAITTLPTLYAMTA